MRFWVDRYVIWIVACAFLLARAYSTADDNVGLARQFFIWVVPVSQTLTLMALYRHFLSRSETVSVGWTFLSRWVGRWVSVVAVSVALCLTLQFVLPDEWSGIAAIPFVVGVIGATAYLLYRIVMDLVGLMENRSLGRRL